MSSRSQLGWVDFSNEDRERVKHALSQLAQPGTLDELGIGGARCIRRPDVPGVFHPADTRQVFHHRAADYPRLLAAQLCASALAVTGPLPGRTGGASFRAAQGAPRWFWRNRYLRLLPAKRRTGFPEAFVHLLGWLAHLGADRYPRLAAPVRAGQWQHVVPRRVLPNFHGRIEKG